MRRHRAAGLFVFGLSVSLASAASANHISLQVFTDGVQTGYYDATDLGCSEGEISQCTGEGLVVGDLRLDSWTINLDTDPVVSGITAVTNLNSSLSQQFTLLFTLVTGPTGSPGTVIGGSVQGGMTDNDGNDATVSTATGSALYSARIDGATVQTLYADPQSFSAGGGFLSGNIPNVAFGTPIPSQPGPGVTTNIGIQLDFVLTPLDSASFTSVFVVEAPEPGTLLLLGSALLGLVIMGGRRAA
jgi:hypothetical protein